MNRIDCLGARVIGSIEEKVLTPEIGLPEPGTHDIAVPLAITNPFTQSTGFGTSTPEQTGLDVNGLGNFVKLSD